MTADFKIEALSPDTTLVLQVDHRSQGAVWHKRHLYVRRTGIGWFLSEVIGAPKPADCPVFRIYEEAISAAQDDLRVQDAVMRLRDVT